MDMIAQTLNTLKERGYRITRTRKAVIDILDKGAKPLSVEMITKKLAQKNLTPNKTTIYRELEMLHKGGFVKEIQLGMGRRMYEITTLGHHHHLVCTKCENIEDISIKNDMTAYKKNIAKKTSFKVFDHSLEFFGLCEVCQ